MNTDGVNIFKSSKLSISPIFLSLNELEFKVRRKNTILVSLWLGLKKPNFHTYLPGFVDQCNELMREGIEWTSGSMNYHSNVRFPIMAADSAAGCLLQGIRQFNGDSSCPWCYDKGKHFEVKGALFLIVSF